LPAVGNGGLQESLDGLGGREEILETFGLKLCHDLVVRFIPEVEAFLDPLVHKDHRDRSDSLMFGLTNALGFIAFIFETLEETVRDVLDRFDDVPV
jgi:hypothetical protein